MEKEDRIDKLARMSADEFAAIRRDMKTLATKDELRGMKVEILDAINDLSLHVNAWVSDTEHRFKDVEQRLHVLENKTGLR
ncbi:MAG: hypothetical protein HY093_00545 [Candidatus Liptonbacteria bacterium]|nr:hypothetical protein [Candidatus Liptonbacteria bacterium]